jgi:N-acetylmuramoyl-L-alanine amidase
MKKSVVITITLILSFLFAANPSYAYTIQPGDTMTKIASENNLSIEELEELNPQIQNLDLIYAGEQIITDEPKETENSVDIAKYIDVEMELLDPLVKKEDHIEELVKITPETQISSIEVTVTKEEPKKTEAQQEIQKYSDYEIDLLARLVRAEAQVEPFEGKVAVACVVLNRVESSAFPDTIKEVIYERRQFQPVSNGEINKPADEESIAAVKAALTEQRDLVSGSLFFYNPTIATSRWLDTRPTTVVIGQHVFKN